MTRIASPYCTIDGQNGKCALPSARKVSLALKDILNNLPPLQAILPIPNQFSLYWGQVLAHDSSHGSRNGKHTGGVGPASCGADNRKLPDFLSSPFTRPIDVDCQDPFYKTYGVKCLNFQTNRILNEDCTVRDSGFVSTLG